ncbi:MAG: DPP IV N-terminal domain-containing protein [Gemmatimonadota bacterium]
MTGFAASSRFAPRAPLLAAAGALIGFGLLFAASPAQAQFGKNKVQYETFDFKVLETEHFDIYYYPEEEAAVLDAARMAERAYARLSKVFRHDWEERKPLILYASHSDFSQTNIFRFQITDGLAGVTEGLRNRIVLFFPSAYPEFDHTLTHELVHAFQFDIMRRGALAQGNNPFAFRAPLWFMEGMAEYLSTGGIDAQTAMWLRDASLAGYLTTLDQLANVGDIRVYRFGQAIWYYIGTKYGDEKVGEIMQKAPLMGVREAFKSSLNLTLEDLSRDWLEAIRLTYLPQVVEYPTAETAARRLTNHVREESSINVGPALSPDGRQVAFVSDRDYFNDIYVADLDDTGDPDKVLKGERTASFESLRFLRVGLAFSPDGKFLAFSSKVGEQDALYIMRVDDEKIVAEHRFGLEGIETPTWSPTGQELVFTGLVGGVSDLFIVGRDGAGLRRLTEDRYAQRDPVWSPDGQRIAFTTDFGAGTDFDLLAYDDYQIGLYELASGTTTFVPQQDGNNINPQWGPRGETLAFISDRTGIPNIFVYNFRDNLTFQITDLLTGVSGVIESSPALAWSRDGRRMVFSAFADAGWDLYRLDDPLALARTPYVAAEEAEYDLAAGAFVRPVAPAPVVPAIAAADSLPADSTAGAPEPDVVVATPGQPDAVSTYLGERNPPPRAGGPAPAGARRLPSFREPVDIATLLRDPTIGLPRDTSDFRSRSYDVKFQPDIISQPAVGYATGNGVFGASQLAFSDLLGDHNLYVTANVYGSLTDSDLFFTYANLKKRLNWGATVYQFRNDFLPLSTGGPVDDYLFRSDVYRGAQVFGAYPFSLFRRVELGAGYTYVDRRVARFDPFDPTPDVADDLPNEAYATPSLAYVYDTAFYGSTGPIGGARQRFEVQRAFGDQSFSQFYGDIRNYWLFARRFTIASRALYLGRFGQSDENVRFQSIGGPTLLRGYDYRDVRLRGTKVGVVNLEFRFPIIERPRLGTSLLPPLRGAAWFDVGFARREDVPFKFSTSDDPGPFGFRLLDGRAAFGVGVRMNLFGFAVVRLDYARPTDLKSLDKPEVLFTLAPEF